MTLPTKDALRRALRVRRLDAAALHDALSAVISEHVQESEVWRAARTVALFASTPEEVGTTALVDAARAAGKQVALPAVVRRGSPLVFRAAPPGMALLRGAYDILEPPRSAPEIGYDALDLVIVPALAVDGTGARLGYGGGYYDRTLPLAPSALRMAILFEAQIVPYVPVEVFDVRMDLAVTEQGLRDFRAPPAAPG